MSDKIIMEEDECGVSKIVTTFLLNSCGLPPWPSRVAVQAAVCCGDIATKRQGCDDQVESVPLITGSVAEFYIEPMLPHIGDIDVMYHYNSYLAIPQGHPPPTQLPAEFHNHVYT